MYWSLTSKANLFIAICEDCDHGTCETPGKCTKEVLVIELTGLSEKGTMIKMTSFQFVKSHKARIVQLAFIGFSMSWKSQPTLKFTFGMAGKVKLVKVACVQLVK